MRSVESVNPQPEEEDEVTQTMASRQAEAVMERIEDVAERAEEGIELDRPRQGLLDRKSSDLDLSRRTRGHVL